MQWSVSVFVWNINMDCFIALPAGCLNEKLYQSLLYSDILLTVSDDKVED